MVQKHGSLQGWTDFGADSIKVIGNRMQKWITENTDTSIVQFQRTGTGLIIDKNAEICSS